MKRSSMKIIISIFLIIGLIDIQFVFASSELVIWDLKNLSESCYSVIVENEDETCLEDEEELESIIEHDGSEITLNCNDRQNEDTTDEIDASGNTTDDEPESRYLHLRNSSSQLFSDVFDAANYLDEQIINYLNGGPEEIEVLFHYDNGDSYKIYQIAYYSHLYNAFCGYGDNLTASIEDAHDVTQYGGIDYYKYIFHVDLTLTRSQAIMARNEAQDIANEANQLQSYYDKVDYINSSIRNIISYHYPCQESIHSGNSPSDGCDTAYSLCTGNAVCSGFTGAFCLVCYELGLNAIPILGYVKKPSGSGGFHAWNLVKYGNRWRQTDCTFDLVLFDKDTNSTRGISAYFNVAFKQNHIIDTNYNCWIQTNAGKSYIDQYGYSVAREWLTYSGHKYYFEKNACMTASKWLEIGGEWYYFNYNGHMVANDWAEDSHGTCYMDNSGHITRSQWLQKNGYWYYLKANGYRAENEWKQDSTGWCYLGANGKMVTNGWAQDSVGWCYMDGSGHITRSQWIQSDGYWYYLKANGYMAANEWAQDSVGWCWMDSSGHITKSQWLNNNGYWYYLKSNGYMAVSEWIEDSAGWCYLGSSGRMVTDDWAQDSTGWCYMDSTGHKTRSQWLHKNGYWYYLKSNGYMAVSEWAIDSNGYCWMDSSGHWDTGTKWIGSPRTIGSSYILSGHRINSQTITIDGYDCTFNGAGQLTTFVKNPGITPGTQ